MDEISRPGRGFTLTELMATLAVLGVLTTVAIPGFQATLANSRLSVTVNGLLHDLMYARTHAATQSVPATVCKSLDGRSCTTRSKWHDGWIVFADANANRRVEVGETILRYFPGTNGAVRIDFRAFGSRNNLTYYPSGFTRNRNGTFTFCDARGGARPRALILYKTGRTRTAHIGPGGRALDCTR